MSATVRAFVLPAFGAAPVLGDLPVPAAGRGEALLRLEAAGLNPVDLAIAAGRFYLPLPEPPFAVGVEAVARVVSSARFPAGTRVWTLGLTGRFADEFVAPDADLVPVPENVPAPLAAALGVAGLAGWMPVVSRGALVPGERILVLGASGSVGQIAIQTARAGGAGWIVAAARSAGGRERALARGADVAIGLDGPEADARRAAAAGDGFDLVIDTLWGAPLAASIPCIRRGGRIVQVGSAAAPSADLVAGPLRGRRIDLRGFSLFSEPWDLVAEQYGRLCRAAAEGRVRIDVDEVPLEAAADAWAAQAALRSGRKLVLVA